MSTDTARDYHAQLEQAERDFGSLAEFAKMLRHANLVLPFIDEITRLPAITDVVAEILGPDLLVLDAPFFIKDAQSKFCILASRPALLGFGIERGSHCLGRLNAGNA